MDRASRMSETWWCRGCSKRRQTHTKGQPDAGIRRDMPRGLVPALSTCLARGVSHAIGSECRLAVDAPGSPGLFTT